MEGWEYFPVIGNTRDLVEQAKEELQLLEYQYPNRFSYLKIELKSFISHLESENVLHSSNQLACMDYVSTQESSTDKKKEVGTQTAGVMEGRDAELPEQQKNDDREISGIRNGGGGTRRDRVDVVLERARACLCKIQQFKATLK